MLASSFDACSLQNLIPTFRGSSSSISSQAVWREASDFIAHYHLPDPFRPLHSTGVKDGLVCLMVLIFTSQASLCSAILLSVPG